MAIVNLPFTAMILAGGLGKRLRPAVSDRPKPMALIDGVPFVRLLIQSLVSKGVRSLVLLTGYKAEMIEEHFRVHPISGIEILFSREESPLGTGGAVRNAADFATDPTLLVNGDTFFDARVNELYQCHLKNTGLVTLTLKRMPDASRYGSVEIDATGKILGFWEKHASQGSPGLINGGVSLLSRELILGLPAGEAFSMEREVFPRLAEEGLMFGHVQDGPLIDIGTPETYSQFQSFVRTNPGLFQGPDNPDSAAADGSADPIEKGD